MKSITSPLKLKSLEIIPNSKQSSFFIFVKNKKGYPIRIAF